jgi:hypothetical protein
MAVQTSNIISTQVRTLTPHFIQYNSTDFIVDLPKQGQAPLPHRQQYPARYSSMELLLVHWCKGLLFLEEQVSPHFICLGLFN